LANNPALVLPISDILKKKLQQTCFSQHEPKECCDRLSALQVDAYNIYTQLGNIIYDTELSKIISHDLNWSVIDEKSPIKEEHDQLFEKLDNALIQDPKLFHKIELFFDTEQTGLRISLATLIAHTHAYVLKVPAYAQVSEIKKIWDTNSVISADFLFIIIGSHAHVTYHEIISYAAHITGMRGVYILLEEQAQLTLLQEYCNRGTVLSHISVIAYTGAQLYVRSTHESPGMTYNFVDYLVHGQQVHIEHRDWASLKQQAQYAFIVKQHHKAPDASSMVDAKILLQDKARSFYRGKIHVDKNAQLTQARQQQLALMLSKQTRTCAIPSLEVLQNHVNCSHGTATSRLQDEHTWYLQSRGLEIKQAESIIIDGFFDTHVYAHKIGTTAEVMIDQLKKYTHEKHTV
jgi:Fe-S cluster assembly scaffold protein SufB